MLRLALHRKFASRGMRLAKLAKAPAPSPGAEWLHAAHAAGAARWLTSRDFSQLRAPAPAARGPGRWFAWLASLAAARDASSATARWKFPFPLEWIPGRG